MAYVDQKMSSGKVVAIVIVALIHIALGYAFVTGLAYQYVKKASEKLNTFDVEPPPPPPPPDEPPPPPPDTPMQPPPVVSPPPIVQNPNPPPVTVSTVPTPPQVYVPTPIAAPPAPPAPVAAPAPAPSVVSKAAGAKGTPSSWVSTDDYPPSAIRAGEEGAVGMRWEISASGRVENCVVTQSSGSSSLDRAACQAMVRRGRYSPALDQAGNPIRTSSGARIRWTLPKE